MQIQPQPMFHTPQNWPELEAWIERHNPDDRAHLYTAALMAWNLAASITSNTDECEAGIERGMK